MPAAVNRPKTDFEKAINDLPPSLKKELKKDKTLRKRFKVLWESLGSGADTIRGKLNRSDIPELDVTITKKRTLPTGRGGTEALFSLGRSKYKPKSKPSQEARERKNVKGVTRPKPSVKDVAPLGGSSYEIKKGDTLSAIAKRKNTTVAALMRMNPKIKDKDKIRAGQFIKVGSPTRAAAKTKSTKDLNKPTSVAQAKRMGKAEYWDTKTENWKAAVTAAELKKSGLSLRAYLN